MEEQVREKDAKVEVEFSGALEPKSFDIGPYVGQKTRIATADTHYNKKYDSYYLRVATEPVAYVGDDPDKPVTASRLYGLMSQDGNFGWKKGGDLDRFLAAMGAKGPRELVGKEVLMLPSEPNKDGVRFLTFN